MELNEAGEPLKPNERRVPRDEFGPELEAHWGIKLAEIDDEVVLQKEDETLFIDAGGQIFIKTKAPWYPGETGKSYASTEEMLVAEARWDELREYLRKVREKMEPFFSRPPAEDPRLVLMADWAEVERGRRISVRVVAAGVAQDAVQIAGLVLAFDPAVVRLAGVVPAEGVRVIDQDVRPRSASRSVLRVRLKRGAGDAARPGTLATLEFEALAPGETLLEPLSVEASADAGKTYLEIGNRVLKPTISEVRIRVR